jgi:hypothetical protein
MHRIDDNVAKKCLPAGNVDFDRNLSLKVRHKSNKSENNRPDQNQGMWFEACGKVGGKA